MSFPDFQISAKQKKKKEARSQLSFLVLLFFFVNGLFLNIVSCLLCLRCCVVALLPAISDQSNQREVNAAKSICDKQFRSPVPSRQRKPLQKQNIRVTPASKTQSSPPFQSRKTKSSHSKKGGVSQESREHRETHQASKRCGKDWGRAEEGCEVGRSPA